MDPYLLATIRSFLQDVTVTLTDEAPGMVRPVGSSHRFRLLRFGLFVLQLTNITPPRFLIGDLGGNGVARHVHSNRAAVVVVGAIAQDHQIVFGTVGSITNGANNVITCFDGTARPCIDNGC